MDYIDESEVLTPADESHHVEKHDFRVPFVCGCRNLGEALRRISEGAAMSKLLICLYPSQKLLPAKRLCIVQFGQKGKQALAMSSKR